MKLARTEMDRPSGGVAMLIPLEFELYKYMEIAQGLIHVVLLATRISTFYVVNCDFHPIQKGTILE